jgi:putative endonuclease
LHFPSTQTNLVILSKAKEPLLPQDPIFAVYILASRSRTLYIGVTNSLRRRILEHKCKHVPGFTASYNCNRLVWFSNFEYINNAIATEKRLKGWLRSRKIALIEEKNPTWEDLSASWFTPEQLEKFGSDEPLSPLRKIDAS